MPANSSEIPAKASTRFAANGKAGRTQQGASSKFEATVYTSLLRLQQQGWIESEWGTSENNRKARFYSITRRGRTQLAVETENWERISGVIGCVLRLEAEK